MHLKLNLFVYKCKMFQNWQMIFSNFSSLTKMIDFLFQPLSCMVTHFLENLLEYHFSIWMSIKQFIQNFLKTCYSGDPL